MLNVDTGTTRRSFMAAGGLGAALVLVQSTPAQAASLSDVEKANEKVVNDFCASWASLDVDKIGSFLADTCVFRMIESSPRLEGRENILEGIKGFLATAKSANFEMLRSTARGNMVINERIDHFDTGERQNAFHITGFFLVKEGKIVEWQDYTMPTTT